MDNLIRNSTQVLKNPAEKEYETAICKEVNGTEKNNAT